MWESAKKCLLDKSTLEIENNKFVGTPCRILNGTIKKDGYGTISIHGRTILSHVLSCSIKNKMHRPDDKVTRHLCGNKLCINEEHLEFGTNSENAIDNLNHGKCTKFTKEQIIEIREKFKTGNFTKVALGKIFNTSSEYIRRIVKNNIWKHLI